MIEIDCDCFFVVVRSQWSLSPRTSPSLFMRSPVGAVFHFPHTMHIESDSELHPGEKPWRASVMRRAAALMVEWTASGGGWAERSRLHSHRFTEKWGGERWGRRGVGGGGGGGGGAHRSECKSARPKGIFASARLDAHLFRQSGVSSRILANNISSASFSFRRGSSALYFWTLCPFASVGCRRFCFFVFFYFYFSCMLVFVYTGPACTRVPLPGNGKRAYLGKCVF